MAVARGLSALADAALKGPRYIDVKTAPGLPRPEPSVKMRGGLLVLPADEFDEVRVELDGLIDLHRPWPGIRFGIIDGDFDFQIAVIHAPEPLDPLCGVGQRSAVDIEPPAVPESGGLNHQRVTLPLPGRIAVPPRLRIVCRQRPSVGEDLPDAGIALVQD